MEKDKKQNEQGALAGVGKAMNMMPTGEKMNADSNADPAIKKDTSALLHKNKDGKGEQENEESEQED